ncbi:MAG: SRPBCC family protein [Candidatus Andersenbacteria bacterium]|nr:SRPBCC family protein [Candidatus Andersenbacteria bacterium]
MWMNAYLFSFKTVWNIPHDVKTVWDHVGMVAHYPQWWPGMKQVEMLHGHELPVDVGNAFRFTVASPLYQLRYTTTVTACDPGKKIVARSEGDLKGVGTWTFVDRGRNTEVTFLWEVSLTPLLLRLAGNFPPVRPVMRFFHNRLMRGGERGLIALLSK